MSGLPQLFSGWSQHPLNATINAHANHDLPMHFGFVVEWPSHIDHYIPALLNVRMENWIVNRWIRSARFPSWEHMLYVNR